MNRTQKKCMVASTGIHLLLLVILLVGPAFFAGKPPIDHSQIIEFIPLVTTDLKASGGGDPTVTKLPAAAKVETPQADPEPPKPAQKEPEIVAPPVSKPRPQPKAAEPEKKEDSESLEVSSKRPKPKVNLNLVKRNTDAKEAAKVRAAQQAREAAASQRRLAERLDRAVSGIRGGLSGSTEIRLKGPGGGGVPYANFYDAVKSVYARAWRVPDDATDDSATAVASIVIAKDGTVISARIVKSSGNTAVDRSVRTTLDNVKFAAPLPATETAPQREVTINFNVRAAKMYMG
ncbi:MAG TPA: TonB family protein [Verrucomicrobiae bacterium]|nr:TonB family protein [Verrucomicrobiae bacterium]